MIAGSDFFDDGSPMWNPVTGRDKAVTIIPPATSGINSVEMLTCPDVIIDSSKDCFSVDKGTQFVFVERAQINMLTISGNLLIVNTKDNTPLTLVFVNAAELLSAVDRITAIMNNQYDPGCIY